MPSARERLRRYLSAIDRDETPTAHVGLVLTVATLCLVFMEYAAERPLLRWVYALRPDWYDPHWAQLIELATWVSVRVIGFLVLPALTVLWLKQPLRDYGLRATGLVRQLPAYGVLFLLVLPALLLAARRPEFARYYPFYRHAARSWLDLALWEALYALHFVALEFFFRGFLLTGLRQRVGHQAVFVAVVPYCMIHFTKPLLEVVAAIPAGIILGLLAMRARSIWGGALLHIAVAWTMDALALAQGSGLPSR